MAQTNKRSLKSIRVGDEIFNKGRRGKLKEVRKKHGIDIYVTEDEQEFDIESTVRVPDELYDDPLRMLEFDNILDDERDRVYAEAFLEGKRPYDFEKEGKKAEAAAHHV